MSVEGKIGEGEISSYGEIADRLPDLSPLAIAPRFLKEPAAPAFDQRPGILEATRGLKPHVRFLGVLGDHAPQGWRIVLQLHVDGTPVLVPVAPGDARRLGEELHALADLVELGVDRFVPEDG